MSDVATNGTFQVADANDQQSTQTEESGGRWGDIASGIWGKVKQAKDVVVDGAIDVKDKVVEEAGKIDGEQLLEDGKKLGDTIVKGVQGKTGNEDADRIIQEAGEWIPGAGIVQEGAELLDKSNVLEGGESEITGDDVKQAIKRAGPELIGVPQGVQDAAKVKRFVDRAAPGLSEKVVDAVTDAATGEGTEGEVVTESEGDEQTGLQPMKLVDDSVKTGKQLFNRFFSTGGDKED